MYNPYSRYTTDKQDEPKPEHSEFEPVRIEKTENEPAQDTWYVNERDSASQPRRRRRTDLYNRSGEDE